MKGKVDTNIPLGKESPSAVKMVNTMEQKYSKIEKSDFMLNIKESFADNTTTTTTIVPIDSLIKPKQ